MLQKSLPQREKYLKNLWKLDSEEKNVIELYSPLIHDYHSFFGHFFLLWAHEAHCVKLAKEQGSWNIRCDTKKKKMLIIMVYVCFGWFLKIKSVDMNKQTN